MDMERTPEEQARIDSFLARLGTIHEWMAPYFVGAKSREEAISRMPFAMRAGTREFFEALDENAADREKQGDSK